MKILTVLSRQRVLPLEVIVRKPKLERAIGLEST